MLTSSEIQRSSWKSGGVLLWPEVECLTYQLCLFPGGGVSVKKVSEAKDLGTKAEDSCLKHEKFGGIRRRWEFDEFMVELSIWVTDKGLREH